jgi:hypothetical protein
MGKKKWTLKGIKRYFPSLSFEDWLKICLKHQHYNKKPDEVIAGFIGGNI